MYEVRQDVTAFTMLGVVRSDASRLRTLSPALSPLHVGEGSHFDLSSDTWLIRSRTRIPPRFETYNRHRYGSAPISEP